MQNEAKANSRHKIKDHAFFDSGDPHAKRDDSGNDQNSDWNLIHFGLARLLDAVERLMTFPCSSIHTSVLYLVFHHLL
ncbi:MAG: hypothetical protein MZU97_20535 [Bacillus subtilis]|nr:hypothetical protein [Bacillus subtilis]